MYLSKYKHLFITLFLIAVGSALATYQYIIYLSEEETKEQEPTALSLSSMVITPKTEIIIKEKHALCQKYGLVCGAEQKIEGTVRAKYNNLTQDALKKKHPEVAGWHVYWQKNQVVLEQILEGICPEHSNCWHLSDDNIGEKLAVYLGPSAVGREGEIIMVTDIYLDNLPADLQKKIREGVIEFFDWEELIAMLDSLAEYNVP